MILSLRTTVSSRQIYVVHRYGAVYRNAYRLSSNVPHWSVTIQPKSVEKLTKRFLSVSNRLNKKDYYAVLNVSKNATTKELKQSYYTLAKKYHPDTNPDDKTAKAKFTEVAEAYEVLSDSSKRANYDNLGPSGYHNQEQYGGGTQNQQGFSSTFTTSGGAHIDPEELFKTIFAEFTGTGGRKARRATMGNFFDGFGERPGQGMRSQTQDSWIDTGPYSVDITLRFEEAARGCNKRINLEIYDTCTNCDGTGATPGTKVARCGFCSGTGVETTQQGPFVMQSTCRKCSGTGKIILEKCYLCEGLGQSKQQKSIVLSIPAGVIDGQVIKSLVGKVDVFITISVLQSRTFKRKDDDVLSLVNVGIAQAVLGGSTQVQTLHGEETMVIEPGTSSGQRYVLKGRGIKKLQQTGYGDHICTLEITVPKYDSLTTTQKEQIINFGQHETFTGFANGVVSSNSKREKYDQQSRKFHTENEDENKNDSDYSENVMESESSTENSKKSKKSNKSEKSTKSEKSEKTKYTREKWKPKQENHAENNTDQKPNKKDDNKIDTKEKEHNTANSQEDESFLGKLKRRILG